MSVKYESKAARELDAIIQRYRKLNPRYTTDPSLEETMYIVLRLYDSYRESERPPSTWGEMVRVIRRTLFSKLNMAVGLRTLVKPENGEED